MMKFHLTEREKKRAEREGGVEGEEKCFRSFRWCDWETSEVYEKSE